MDNLCFSIEKYVYTVRSSVNTNQNYLIPVLQREDQERRLRVRDLHVSPPHSHRLHEREHGLHAAGVAQLSGGIVAQEGRGELRSSSSA